MLVNSNSIALVQGVDKVDQMKMKKSPETDSYIYGHLIPREKVGLQSSFRNSLFNKWCCIKYISIRKKEKMTSIPQIILRMEFQVSDKSKCIINNIQNNIQ